LSFFLSSNRSRRSFDKLRMSGKNKSVHGELRRTIRSV
jgi:hypothetical protein